MTNKICCVCNADSSKYKCPKCKQFYCSAVCCNKHKENCTILISENSKVDEVLPKTTNVTYDFPTDDTVPIERLEQLRESKEVKECLRNPQVRDIIKSVLQDKNPTEAIAKAMTEPVFVDLADKCLKLVEISDEDKPC